MFELVSTHFQQAVIKVMGVGGGGGNAVAHMFGSNIEGVQFICANTDAQALKKLGLSTILQLGQDITKGLGAGADPNIGRQAAEADREQIKQLIEGADMVFITAGMGGGTGTGAAPVVASVAREMGILTVAVVTKPFSFEGKKRMVMAEEGIKELGKYVDSLITIPNDKLLTVLGKNVSLLNAFKAANNVLLGAVQGIAELITKPGLINVDFADVRTVMSEMGMAMMGTGVACGENRAREAAESAVASPLLENIDLSGARGVLVNVTAGLDISIGEFEEVGEIIKKYTAENATVVVGLVTDPELKDELRVTIVLTGLGSLRPVQKPQNVQEAALPHETVEVISLEGREPASAPEVDYAQLDRPTMLRRQHFGPSTPPSNHAVNPSIQRPKVSLNPEKEQDLEYLDIPAFLRRQEEASR